MNDIQVTARLGEFMDGRTDVIFELLAAGVPPDHQDANGISLLQHCAYFGDVSALKLLLSHGQPLASLGDNFDLNGACFHGHWRLCQFLLEQGANVNQPSPDTGETPLHSALCNTDRLIYDRVVTVLLSAGANPNAATKEGVETGAFMRDCRTKGEAPLHRAAAFGSAETVSSLIAAGAKVDARDMNGDTPLSWGSWYGRPNAILRQLCYGNFRIHPQNREMRANLVGDPRV